MLAPLPASTPMTRNGMFLMRIVWLIGSLVWNSLRDQRLADDADLGGGVHVALA